MKNKYRLICSMMLAAGLGISSLHAQNVQERKKLTAQYDKSALLQLEQEYKQKAVSEKEAAIQMAQTKGWEIIKTMPDGSYMELQKVTADGYPIYYTTFNVDAARSTRTNHLNSGGSLGLNLMGQNMTAHVWDGGIARASHQEYHGAGGSNRFTVGDGSSSLNFHAAHVTGTIISSGVQAAAKGMAPHARAIGYDWNNDLSEATSAASSGMLISNHSYGYRSDLVPNWYFGAYIDVSRDWDNLMRNSPYYLMVVAAGNDGSTNYNGSPMEGNPNFDKLTGHSTSKNNMVVANANDANVDNNGNLNSVVINSSSSQGPTSDYRIKPDITGNGTGVYSTYHNSNTAYNSITGTSMASPNVAGSLLLLQQHYNNVNGNYMRAATLKGLALHTADDAGMTGPDAVYGWGLMNTKRAAEAISNNGVSTMIEELTLTSGQTYSVTVEADGVSPLLASISWTDLPGTANTGTTNDPTPKLVNDLDIRVTKNSTTYLPWKLTAVNANAKMDNNVDPFERVDISGASGSYTITVTNKGSLSGGSQNFSLIVTGITADPVVCEAVVPTGLSASNITATTADISWTAVPGANYDVRYRETGTSTWTTVNSNGSSTTLSGLSESTQYDVQVRSKCSEGGTSSYSSTVNFTTTEVQLEYCSSNGNNTSDEYISNVTLADINNNSGAGSGGYSDFTNISTDLSKGENYTISVTTTWTGSLYNEGYSVWIDFNQNGTFESNEQVWTQSPTTAAPVGGSFSIPSSALEGNTRMRVSMKYNAIPTACESFAYGEVEDYTVNITGAQATCNTPAGLNVSNLTNNTASLNWAAVSGAVEYEVRLKRTNTSTWSSATTANTTVNATGLTEGAEYEFQVRAVCAGGTSDYSASFLFTTEVPCTVPTGLNASNITANSATLNWSAQSGSNEYNVRFRRVGTSSWTTATTSGTSVNATGLTSSEDYEFQVRSVCGSSTSDYSASANFTTLTPCLVPAGLNAGNIAQTTATLSWSSASGANSYGVRIRAVGTSAWTNLSSSSTSLNISSLIASTQYEFQVRSVCSDGNSAYSSSATFTTSSPSLSYCSSQGNNSSYEWIRRVRLNEIDNESGNNGGYADFTSQVATVQRGASVTMNVQAGFSGQAYNQYWSIWVDLNQDGQFTSNERLVNGSSSSSNLLSATLSIPSTALTGQTRMRVTMKYNSAATPCETFAYGEVEDYTVNIVNSLSANSVLADNLESSPLGKEDNPALAMVYPNPATEFVNFRSFDLDPAQPIRILSANGALVREIKTDGNEVRINVSDLAQGMYMIQAHSKRNDQIIEKFMVK